MKNTPLALRGQCSHGWHRLYRAQRAKRMAIRRKFRYALPLFHPSDFEDDQYRMIDNLFKQSAEATKSRISLGPEWASVLDAIEADIDAEDEKETAA